MNEDIKITGFGMAPVKAEGAALPYDYISKKNLWHTIIDKNARIKELEALNNELECMLEESREYGMYEVQARSAYDNGTMEKWRALDKLDRWQAENK